MAKFGVKSWSFIARQLQGRLGKQCRERWYNHLNPDIVKQPWRPDEDRIIIEVSQRSALLPNDTHNLTVVTHYTFS